MRKEYNFSQAIKNPYTKGKKAITIRLDDEAISYFKKLSSELDLPYQTLINLYLTDCAKTHKKPSLAWE